MNPELIYKIVITGDWQKAEQWCLDKIGPWNEGWYKLGIDPAASLVGDNTTTWYFKDPQRAAWFALNWA